MARRDEEAVELEAGLGLGLRRRATVWGLSWAKMAARVSSEAAAASISISIWAAAVRKLPGRCSSES